MQDDIARDRAHEFDHFAARAVKSSSEDQIRRELADIRVALSKAESEIKFLQFGLAETLSLIRDLMTDKSKQGEDKKP